MDWMMPEFGGEWLLPRLNQSFRSQRPQLFVLSGSEQIADKHRSLVDARIPKPLNQDLLISRLKHACPAV